MITDFAHRLKLPNYKDQKSFIYLANFGKVNFTGRPSSNRIGDVVKREAPDRDKVLGVVQICAIVVCGLDEGGCAREKAKRDGKDEKNGQHVRPQSRLDKLAKCDLFQIIVPCFHSFLAHQLRLFFATRWTGRHGCLLGQLVNIRQIQFIFAHRTKEVQGEGGVDNGEKEEDKCSILLNFMLGTGKKQTTHQLAIQTQRGLSS